jgi:hypothetical protein
VPQDLLGRTNQAFPKVWLSLSAPEKPTGDGWLGELASAARAADTILDVSSGPALWGSPLRGVDARLMTIGNLDLEQATDETHASDLLQAHLIETLSALGRESIELYFLRVRRALEDHQISGALLALEAAREDGHVRFLGICCDGLGPATLNVWQFHDAFDVLLVPRNHRNRAAYGTLAPMARERRVGIVTSRPLNWGYGVPFVRMPSQWKLRNLTQSFYGLTLAQSVIADLAEDHPVLVGVRTPEEVRLAVEAPLKPRPDGLPAMLQPFLEAFEDEAEWRDMLTSEDGALREAANRRLRDLERV